VKVLLHAEAVGGVLTHALELAGVDGPLPPHAGLGGVA